MALFASEFRRVVVGRLSEWQCSFATLLFGIVLLAPASTYGTGAGWTGFEIWISEPTLGTLMFGFGLFRVAILGINGFWRPTYYLRAVGACLSMGVWLMICMGFASSGYVGTWLAVYPVLAVAACINTFRALDDARHMEVARRAHRAFGIARHAPHPG